jgi:hypothetical protein
VIKRIENQLVNVKGLLTLVSRRGHAVVADFRQNEAQIV